MIVPNCRQHITSADLEFALESVAGARPRDPIGALLPPDVDIDELLDSRELFEALLRSRRVLAVSPWFFYYVLVRQVFVDRGLPDRLLADYVGALLAHFLEGRRLRENAETAPRSFVYLVDMVEAARGAGNPQAAFALEARIGDVALFLTGMFPDAIHHRHTYGRRLPGLDYYEAVGRSGYRAAARHAPARHADLGELLDAIASRFAEVRRALNELSDSHFCMRRGRVDSVERLLRQALWSGAGETRDEGERAEGFDA